MPLIFSAPDELCNWAESMRAVIVGPFCFAATIHGWYVLAEWDGSAERPPKSIARHTRGFWEFDSDYIFGVGNKPTEEH
jgi:hypothetical protein